MSNLRAILDRLVQENLHGPIDPSSHQDTIKSHAIRQAQQQVRGPHADPYRDPRESQQRHDIDLDAHDPRWRQLFHELFVSDQSDDRNDDLLFFVQRVSDEIENGGLGVDPVFVKRKVKGIGREILTPEQEDVVLWKDTFFLNLIVQLQCKLTVAVCSRVSETNPVTGTTKTSMMCTRKHVSKRVYASPTKSRMDVKEESVECSWPLIYYVIDDFEDSFEQLMVRDNEYLCVELAVTIPTARTTGYPNSTSTINNNPSGVGPQPGLTSAPLTLNTTSRIRGTAQDSNWSAPQSPTGDALQPGRPFPSTSTRGGSKVTLFQGAAGFQSLLGIYQQKAASKVGRRFKLGPHTVPTEFVMMRGPGARGHAQVAITASSIGDDLTTLDDGGSGSPTSPQTNSEKGLPPIPGSQQDNHHHPNGERTAFAEGYGNVHSQQGNHQPSRIETSSQIQSGPTSPTSAGGGVSSVAKSFSTGSFFQSLRRISLATLAQATGLSTQQLQQQQQQQQQQQPRSSYNGHGSHANGTGGVGYEHGSNNGVSSAVHSLTQNLNQSTPSFNSSSSPPNSPSSAQQQQQRHASEKPIVSSASALSITTQNGQQPANSNTSNKTSTSSSFSNSSRQQQQQQQDSGVGTRQEIEALVKSPQSLRCCMTFVNVPWTGIVTMLMDHAYHPSFSAGQGHGQGHGQGQGH